ncbi:hypothetical protein E2562_004258 [Oryza meyeriana var. granulata]|uniref:Uncharacterized protein n=1 Tax=Oryza meyeriana var. granulata TaxID=110450 RepID=A0A6G1BRY9_9ORYZ|nr:hypothetical protein E2562_004258 [Oryza meyeriana var. granulata]
MASPAASHGHRRSVAFRLFTGTPAYSGRRQLRHALPYHVPYLSEPSPFHGFANCARRIVYTYVGHATRACTHVRAARRGIYRSREAPRGRWRTEQRSNGDTPRGGDMSATERDPARVAADRKPPRVPRCRARDRAVCAQASAGMEWTNDAHPRCMPPSLVDRRQGRTNPPTSRLLVE